LKQKEVIGVRFKALGEIHFFQAPEKYQVGDLIIAQTKNGKMLGKVYYANRLMSESDLPDHLSVVTKATDSQKAAYERNIKDAQCIKKDVMKCIVNLGLGMKLLEVEYTLDRERLVVYFTAEGRVDFRELLKVLAGKFHLRIELRQVGPRDEAKAIGGLGPCGRVLCCSSFLGDFVPVSIKMAKNQNLSLNPIKISGLCGRLLCCLQYEDQFYEVAKRRFPDWGQKVETEDGIGRAEGLSILENIVKVRFEKSPALIDYDVEEIKFSK
jgi:cell fate regulator YaaT (PSP1 superfamily)